MKLLWVLIGLISGSTAKMMTNPGHGGSWLISLGIGVLGAGLLGWLGQEFGWLHTFRYHHLLWPIIGSLVFLYAYHKYLSLRSE